MLIKQLKALLLFIGFCITSPYQCISQNTIKSNSETFSLTYFKEDISLSRNEITSKRFITMPKSSSFGVKNGTYWFKLTIKKTEYSTNLISYIPTHNIGFIEVYQLENQNLKYITSTGNNVARNNLPLDYKFPSFKVNSKKLNDNTYFLKVLFPKEANFPLKIKSEKKFLSYLLEKKTINSLYYGTCIIILLMNIFFCIKFKDKTYLYYTLFLSSLGINFLLYDGSLIHLFRGNSFYYKLELIIHLTNEIWFILFSISFLNLNIRIPKITKSFFIFPIIVILLYSCYLITNNFYFIGIADTIGISLFPILWFFGLLYYKKIPYAKFYVLGYLLIIPFAVFFIIGYPSGFWEVHGDMLIVKIASWLDIIVFTYAISYRLKTKFENNNLNIKQLKIDIEVAKNKLASKNNSINPYLVLLNENELTSKPLTLREIDILKHLNEGFNNKEISEKLFISPNTVKHHIRNIYIKINVNSRTSLKEKTFKLVS